MASHGFSATVGDFVGVVGLDSEDVNFRLDVGGGCSVGGPVDNFGRAVVVTFEEGGGRWYIPVLDPGCSRSRRIQMISKASSGRFCEAVSARRASV